MSSLVYNILGIYTMALLNTCKESERRATITHVCFACAEAGNSILFDSEYYFAISLAGGLRSLPL